MSSPVNKSKIRTVDCFHGCLRRETDTLGELPWNTINPCTGPIFVDGAVPGDILKIEIDEIALDKRGITIQDKGDLLKYGIEQADKSMYLNISNEEILIGEHLSYPVSPMIGTIGTAPKEGEHFDYTPWTAWRQYGLRPNQARKHCVFTGIPQWRPFWRWEMFMLLWGMERLLAAVLKLPVL